MGEHVRTCTKKMFNGFDERERTIALVVSLKIPFTKSYDMEHDFLPQNLNKAQFIRSINFSLRNAKLRGLSIKYTVDPPPPRQLLSLWMTPR